MFLAEFRDAFKIPELHKHTHVHVRVEDYEAKKHK